MGSWTFFSTIRFLYKKVSHASSIKLSWEFQQISALKLSYDFLKITGSFCYFDDEEIDNIQDIKYEHYYRCAIVLEWLNDKLDYHVGENCLIQFKNCFKMITF